MTPKALSRDKKICFKCSGYKTMDNFRKKKDGYYEGWCTDCSKKYHSEWRKKNIEKVRKYTKTQIDTGAKHGGVYVRWAVQSGDLADLKKETILCVYCKLRRASVYDHRDYNFPLNVVPACISCNRVLPKAIPRKPPLSRLTKENK